MSSIEKNIKKKPTVAKKISLLCNVLMWVLSSVFINFILEALQRRSLVQAAVHMFTSAPVFLMNTAIIMLCTSFMLIVKRKLFALALPAVLWLVVGITNTICLTFRPLPISFSDFRLAGEAFEIMGLYLSVKEIVLIVVGVAAAIAGLVVLFMKGPRFECDKKKFK